MIVVVAVFRAQMSVWDSRERGKVLYAVTIGAALKVTNSRALEQRRSKRPTRDWQLRWAEGGSALKGTRPSLVSGLFDAGRTFRNNLIRTKTVKKEYFQIQYVNLDHKTSHKGPFCLGNRFIHNAELIIFPLMCYDRTIFGWDTTIWNIGIWGCKKKSKYS